MLTLYTYFRSSAAYRVRIALNLKGLDYAAVPVHLTQEGGAQHRAAYRAKNPFASVPTLATDDALITQSLAIIEYLDETCPTPPLLPATAAARARVRAIAQGIACDIHPLNNLRVLNYLTAHLGVDEAAKNAWYRHWVGLGLAAIERLLADSPDTGACCHGDTPTLADCCLVPQVLNARRFDCPLDALPTVTRIAAHCERLDAFVRAAPQNQPDAPPP